MLSIDSSARSASADWFEPIVEGIPYAIIMVDRDGRIALVNRKTEGLFGYSRAELVEERIELLLPRAAPDAPSDRFTCFFAAAAGTSVDTGQGLGLRKDGVEVPLDIRLDPIATSSGVFALASINEIERAGVADDSLRLAALVESADDAILSKSLDGVIRTWNAGAERLLGYRADEIIGRSVMELLPDDRRTEEAMILDRISKGHRVAHLETVRRRRDGSHVDVSLTISPIRDRTGSIVGASKIMRDITARKRSEDELRRKNVELQRINDELDSFVYTASHDLRAPLAGVATVAQWILQDDPSISPDTRRCLLLIQGRIERMKRLLNDIRDFARIGRSGELSGETIGAAALVADVAANSNVPGGFSVHCDASLAAVQIRRVPLEQVMHNLINNAIKHHDRDAGSVTVSVEPAGSRLRFWVIDDGPGIPAEYREMVFEMFKTLRPRDEREGSGMGLALVRKIVARMGGSCGVEPAGDRGAKFWFDWPAGPAAA